MKTIIFILISLYFISCQNTNEPDLSQNDLILPIESRSIVENKIKTISTDAKLLSISSDNVNTNGKSSVWFYKYFSQSINKFIYIHAMKNEVIIDSLSSIILTGASIIDENCIESNIVLNKSEENGGKEFRNRYPNSRIELSLYKPLIPDASIIWYVLYNSNDNINNLFAVAINAKTGDFINIIE